MASVKKKYRYGKLCFKVSVSNGESLSGKQIRKTKTFYPTAPEGTKKCEKELNAFIAEMEKEFHEGKYYDGNNMTYAVFARDIWKPQYAEKNLSAGVLNNYWNELKNVIFPVIGNMKLSKITGVNCQDVINRMEEETGRRGSSLSPATIKRRYVIMRSVFNYAYKLNLIADNPCNRCTLPKEKHKEELRTFSEDQAVAFLQFLHDGYDTKIKDGRKHTGGTTSKGYTVHVVFPLWQQVYFYIAIYGGLRRGEELALTWNDIDFVNNEITINKSLKLVKNQIVLGSTKTESGNRTITLPSICFNLLKQLYAEERDLCSRSGNNWKGEPLDSFKKNTVFIQASGDKVGSYMYLTTPYRALTRIIKAYNRLIDDQIAEGKKAGTMSAEEIQKKEESKLPLLRLHDMRHTSATIQLAEGVDIETVKNRLGHAKASTTIDIYGHALKNRDKEASEKIENALHVAKSERDRKEQATLPEMLTPDELEILKAYRSSSSSEKKQIYEHLESSEKISDKRALS